MSRFCSLLLSSFCLAGLSLGTANVDAREIDRFLSGSWYNPAQSGHGFSVEISDDGVVVFYWYTYHPDGTPTFLLAVGQASGNRVTAQAFYNTGMHFGVFDPDERTESPWGTITLTFHDCNSATVEYASTMQHGGMSFGSGSFPIQRLVSINQLQCQDQRTAGIYEGTVFSSLDGETFYGFVLVSPDRRFAAFSNGGIAAFGDLTESGINLNLSGAAVSLNPDTPFAGAFSGTGDVSPEYRLFSFYNVAGGDNGFGDFYAVPALYRRNITLASLAGNYAVRNPVTGFTGNATLGNNGNITGTDELGCQYAGHIEIPDSRFNVFEVTVTITNCPGFNATYEGLGSQIDWFRVDDRRGLRVLVTDGNFGFLLMGNR